jgi:hypothetical protein
LSETTNNKFKQEQAWYFISAEKGQTINLKFRVYSVALLKLTISVHENTYFDVAEKVKIPAEVIRIAQVIPKNQRMFC